MKYICPDIHYIPSTYGEITRDGSGDVGLDGKTNEERSQERTAMLEANGYHPYLTDGAITSKGFEWATEVILGYRCWYCGAVSPRGLERAAERQDEAA